MHPAKSKFMLIWSCYNLRNKSFKHPVVANNTPVSQVDTHKCLVVQIDEKVTWDSHNDMICEIVPLNSLEKVYKSL